MILYRLFVVGLFFVCQIDFIRNIDFFGNYSWNFSKIIVCIRNGLVFNYRDIIKILSIELKLGLCVQIFSFFMFVFISNDIINRDIFYIICQLVEFLQKGIVFLFLKFDKLEIIYFISQKFIVVIKYFIWLSGYIKRILKSEKFKKVQWYIIIIYKIGKLR